MNPFIKKMEGEFQEEIREKADPKKKERVEDSILSHYFTLSDGVATVRLNYDTFSELVDQSLGDDSVEKLNSVLFDKLAEIFELIPRKYKIEVEVYIKDFENYTMEEADKIVRKNFALLIYSFAKERRRKYITGLSLLGGGIALLLISYFLDKINLPQIFFDVINISGTLLVWEAADITLIERSSEVKRAKQYVRKFKDIRLVKAE